MKSKFSIGLQGLTMIFFILGALLGSLEIPLIKEIAEVISSIFINLLKLISLPMIFLSLISTVSGMKDIHQIRTLGGKIVKYTFMTTLMAACVALICFIIIDPVGTLHHDQNLFPSNIAGQQQVQQGNYWDFLLRSLPDNILDPFLKNNVIGILFIAILLSAGIISLPEGQKNTLHAFFQSAFAAILNCATMIMRLMPIAVASFVILFFHDIKSGLNIKNIALYISCVVLANIVQALFVLPLLTRWKGISPIKLFQAMAPALTVAFFSKSSAASLPTVIQCAEQNAMIPRKITRLSLPMCSTINMNACAGFILITVLFVSSVHGMTFSHWDLISWIFIASIAAIGNAAVPMGCYFLASSFLASQNIPLNIMGVILPVYSLLDMLETAINVWSDSCVTAIVAKETEC